MMNLNEEQLLLTMSVISECGAIPSELSMPDEQLYENELINLTADMLRMLAPREALIVAMRFYYDMTYREIGDHFSLSRERIRQILKKALKKMKHPSKSKHLNPYLEGICER